MTKLFISHAASDKPLVKLFVELVERGIGVSPRDIFCSTLEGQGVRAGDDFKSSIRSHLDEATCVIALITPNFYGSAFCMCELGAVWMRAKDFIPILVPPLVVSDLRAVLAGLHALKIGDKADLDGLRDEIEERTAIRVFKTPRWNESRDDFLQSLPETLTQLPAETPVARATHHKTLKELEDYKSEYKKSEAEVQRLREIVVDLTKLKDKKKATAVSRRHSPANQVFRSLVDAAKDALGPLPSCVRVALYYRTRNADYYLKSSEEFAEVERPIENGQLNPVQNEEGDLIGVSPRESDAKVCEAIEALDALGNWLEKQPQEFHDWYKLEFDESVPDMQLRPFWEKHLLPASKLPRKRR